MRTVLARDRRRPGLAKLKAALGGYLPTHDRKSDLERDFDKFLSEHPEIPQPRRNVYIHGWELGIRTLRITNTRFNQNPTGVYEDLISVMKTV